MSNDITYRFFKNRREYVVGCRSFTHALRIAARHHEEGNYPMEIIVNGKKFSTSKILLECKKKGML